MDAFAQGAVSLVKDDTGMWVDYLTDSVILAEAVYNGEESLWEQAAAVYSSGPEEGVSFLFKFSYRIFIQQEIKYVHKYDAIIVLVFFDEVACYHILHKTIVYT